MKQSLFLKSWLEAGYDDPVLWELYGKGLEGLNRLDEALYAYNHLPDFPASSKGLLLSHLGMHDEAVAAFGSAGDPALLETPALVAFTNSLIALGHVDQALDIIGSLGGEVGDDTEILFLYAELLMMLIAPKMHFLSMTVPYLQISLMDGLRGVIFCLCLDGMKRQSHPMNDSFTHIQTIPRYYTGMHRHYQILGDMMRQ